MYRCQNDLTHFPTIANATEVTSWWESEPTCRGTFSILSLCLSTVFICVWKANHPSMSNRRPECRTWIRETAESAKWFLIYLLAPEVLFTTSLTELILACILYYHVNQLDAFPPPSPPWYIRWFWKMIEPVKRSVCGLCVKKALVSDLVLHLAAAYPNLSLDTDPLILCYNGRIRRPT